MNNEEMNIEAQMMADNTGMDVVNDALNEIERLKESGELNEDEESSESSEESVANDEETEDNEEDEVVVKKSDSEKKPDKTWKLKRDKYKALAEKEEAEKRVRELERLLDESVNASTYHYGKNAYNDLERAKINKKIAIENGDVDALIDADEALYKAINAVTELERFTNQPQPVRQQPENEESYTEVYDEIAQDWLESHPELEPDSRNYNADLAKEVGKFVNALDRDLKKNNRMDMFFSQDYFDTINEYIDQLKSEPAPKRPNISSAINSHVGSVRNTYSGGGSVKSTKQITLTADEKRMCSDMEISEKEWIKYKLEELNKGKK